MPLADYSYMGVFLHHTKVFSSPKRFMTMKTAMLHILLALLLLSGCGIFALNDRNADVERSGSGQSIREQLAEQRAMIDDLQREIQKLRGRIQETENSLKQKTKDLEEANSKTESGISRLDDTLNSNNERIQILEKYLNVQPSEKSGFFTEPGGDASDKEVTENEAYALGKQKFERGDLQGAREAFKEFLKTYPNSEQADNAIFWIGETYFHEKWYEKAILEYQKVIDQYPKGNKVPAALLKQGISFFLHGDKTSAQLIMKELMDKYPETSESKIAAKKLKEFEK